MRILFYICSFLIGSVVCIGQDPYHIIFDVNDGLPSSEVYDVEIDKFNNIWFSTDRGLSRYNGYEFENFTTKDGLTDNTIFEIIKDKDSNLWFSCYDGSLSYYDYNCFQEAPFNQRLKKYINRNWVRQMSFDKNGNILFFVGRTTSADTLRSYFKYDKLKDSLMLKSPDRTKGIHRIGYEDKHFYYLPSFDYFTKVNLSVNDSIDILCQTREVNFFSRDMLTEKNMKRYQLNSQVYRSEKDNLKMLFDGDLSIDRIRMIGDSLLYAMTNQGLIRLNINEDNPTYENFFKAYHCSSSLEDYERNIWVTTLNTGIVLIPGMYISHIDNSYFNNSRVMALSKLDNKLIASTFDGQLFCIDKDYNTKKILEVPDRFLKLAKEEDTLYLFDNSRIYEKGGRLITDWNNPESALYSKVFLKVEDEMLMNYHQLIWLSLKSGTFISEDLATETRAMSIHRDYDDRIWVGTLNGIYRIDDFKSNRNKICKIEGSDSLGRINTMVSSENGTVVFGTIGQGLFYHDAENDKIRQFEYDTDQVPNVINSIFIENDSLYWLGSNSGVYLCSVKEKETSLKLCVDYHFNVKNGLASNFIYDVLKWKDKIYVASEKGINVFNKSDIPEFIMPPTIHFDSIVSNLRVLDMSTRQALESDEQDVTFHYSAFSYKQDIGDGYYKYALIKNQKDTSWNLSDSRVVQYTNLEPGEYEFMVMARNGFNNWSHTPASFAFELNPHFSQTIFFKAGVVMLLMFLTFLIYWNRSKQVLLKEVQKRKMQAFEMRAQKAELDALRGQMNPHFVYNALNSIQNYIYKGDEDQANYYLSRFSKLMRSSLEMSKLESITVDEEIEFLKNYLELESMRFKNKFNYKIEADTLRQIPIKIPPLLIQPLVENSIKHGFKKIDYKGDILIQFKFAERHIKVNIIDNGNGIKDAGKLTSNNKSHKSLSIQIIQERLNIINAQNNSKEASLSIQSPILDNSKGTRVSLNIPYIKNNHDYSRYYRG